jgi:lipopolysaccharide/colanic/teichoic acid biosynthesis glycosyltransferase
MREDKAADGILPGTPGWTVKRLLDAAASALGLVMLLPFLLATAALIVIESGWPPLFTQVRIGQGCRRFKLYKFRTMIVGAEKIGAGLYFEGNDPRFTRMGKFLRHYSLDEFPQLWNVLIGDESLVGPRAMIPPIADKLNPQQDQRHRVRPGITGWAQINGRNSLTWSQRIELDNWYISNWSLGLDLRILLGTIPVVLKAAGVRLDQSANDVDDLDGSGNDTRANPPGTASATTKGDNLSC